MSNTSSSRDKRREVNAKSDAVVKRLAKGKKQLILEYCGKWDSSNLTDEEFDKRCREIDKSAIEFLQNCEAPLELHQFSLFWNTDNNPATLLKLIKNPYCDAGTLLRMYWEHEPYFYRHYTTIKDADPVFKESFRVICQIERIFKKGSFLNSRIPFDPKPWIKTTTELEESEDFGAPKKKRVMPEVMFVEIA